MTRDETAGKQTAHLVVRTGEIAEDVGLAKKSKKRVKNSKKQLTIGGGSANISKRLSEGTNP